MPLFSQIIIKHENDSPAIETMVSLPCCRNIMAAFPWSLRDHEKLSMAHHVPWQAFHGLSLTLLRLPLQKFQESFAIFWIFRKKQHLKIMNVYQRIKTNHCDLNCFQTSCWKNKKKDSQRTFARQTSSYRIWVNTAETWKTNLL